MIAKLIKSGLRIYSKSFHRFLPRGAKTFLRAVYNKSIEKMMEKDSAEDTYRIYADSGLFGRGDLVFDIGANRGGFAEVFLRLGAKVVCVEPDPRCVEMLKKKFKTEDRVAIVDAGAGEKEGELELEMGAIDGNATFSKDFKKLETELYSGDYVNKVKARITTLDRLIADHGIPKYCKIDVEGFELQVFRGLSRKIPLVSYEFHREALDEAKKCAKLLCGLGKAEFNYTHFDPSKPIFSRDWMGYDELFEAIEKENKEGVIAYTGDINTYRVGDIFARIS